MVEIGAGTGRLTGALARRARIVMAVEVDPHLADGLRRRFRGDRGVRIVERDFLEVRLPTVPFRAFGNVPFGLGTAILRMLLDDPGSPLVRADLILQYEVARKRASVWPGTLASLGWLPWWEITLARRLPRSCFQPRPRVDAGMLSVIRRDPPLLPAERRAPFLRLLKAGFGRGSPPLGRSLAGLLTERTWSRLAGERGISRSATARDLDVFDWVAVYRLVERRRRP